MNSNKKKGKKRERERGEKGGLPQELFHQRASVTSARKKVCACNITIRWRTDKIEKKRATLSLLGATR